MLSYLTVLAHILGKREYACHRPLWFRYDKGPRKDKVCEARSIRWRFSAPSTRASPLACTIIVCCIDRVQRVGLPQQKRGTRPPLPKRRYTTITAAFSAFYRDLSQWALYGCYIEASFYTKYEYCRNECAKSEVEWYCSTSKSSVRLSGLSKKKARRKRNHQQSIVARCCPTML